MNQREYPRFLEPQDIFYCEDWQGAEIYQVEQYIEFDNGDKVLLFPENILEYLKEHMELTYELLDGVAVKKEAQL